MNASRRKEIERNAAEFRGLLGINSVGISNIFDVCNTKYLLIRYPLGKDGVLGAAIYKDGDYIVFSNSSQVLSREVFTVAHELGHIILRHIGIDNQLMQDISENNAGNEETEADYFAACFLMPKDKVEEFIDFQFQNHGDSEWTLLDVAAVMSTFNVSFETALNRLETIGRIDQTQHNKLLSQKADKKVSNLLRAIGVSPDLCFPKEQKCLPVEFLQWTCANYSQGLIPIETLEKAVGYLDEVSVDDLGVNPPKQKEDFDLDDFLEEDE
jgi:Zn-dependent peptidase ImmA (M78 family)